MTLSDFFPSLFHKEIYQKYESIIFHHVLPLVLYTLITVVMVLLPTGLDLSGKYIGHREVVFWSNYFWWFDYSVTHIIANPFHNSYLFYPLGIDMVDSTFPFFLFIPVTHFFGSVFSYNLYVLFTFILAAYGMFLLSKYFLNDVCIAFISGLIFAFFPFHFGSAFGHLHTFSIMWIPFFVLFFFKMFEKPSAQHVIICSLFFTANALSSWTIAVMLVVFIFLFLIINFKKLCGTDFPKFFFLFVIASLILMSPGLYIILNSYINNPDMVKPFDQFVIYSADFLAFFIPSPIHPLFGSFSQSIYKNFTGNYSENIMFIGLTVIIISIIGVYSHRTNPVLRLFTISLAIFLILSLGPFFHFNGIWRFTDMDLIIYLPGIVTYYLPFFNMIRAPSRYDIMVMFCFAVIAGFGLKTIIIKYELNFMRKLIFCSLISIIILFEYSAVLPTQTVMPLPEFYYEVSHDEKYSILEIPFCSIDSPLSFDTMSRYYEYQKTHQKMLFGGYWSRITPSYNKIIQLDPVLSRLKSGSQDIIISPVPYPLEYLGRRYNVKYVIFHTNLSSDETAADLIQYLGNSYILDNSVSSDQLIIYPIDPSTGFNYSLPERIIRLDLLPGGWFGKEDWNGIPTRWMNENATLLINESTNQSVSLILRARSFKTPRTLEIYSGDQFVSKVSIPTYFIPVNVTVPLKYGENDIRLNVPEGCERPADFPEMNSTDSRCLSLSIQNITLM